MPISVSRSDLKRIVVAIDPAVTSGEDADDSGIIVVARGPHQPSTCTIPHCSGHGYVLDDRTCHATPTEVARIAVRAFDDFQADRIVAEVNNGADYIGTVVHTVRAGVPFKAVRATRGKQLRAEPASALYEQGRCHHLGVFPELEQQMETWTADSRNSPDRLDALVWGLTELGLVGGQGDAFLTAWQRELTNRKPATPSELRHLPHHISEDDRPALRPGCEHRFQEADGKCVRCGGLQPNPEA
jgi:phage terminase large subunit-like protein